MPEACVKASSLVALSALAIAIRPAIAQTVQASAAKDLAGKQPILATSDDGIYIELNDGTKWLVVSSDASTVRGWILGEDVVEIGKSKPCAGTEFINTDEHGETACVRNVSADTVFITAISEDHKYLAMHDGSTWLLPTYADQSGAFIWQVGDHVLYIEDSKTCANVEIINVDEYGEEVCAHPVR